MDIIKLGDRGDAVKQWQEFLAKGFPSVKPDGIFGQATQAATRAFQASVSLRADGIVGDATRKAASTHVWPTATKTNVNRDRTMTVLVSAGHTNRAGQDRGVAANGYIEGVEVTKLRDEVAAILRSNTSWIVVEDGADGDNEPLTRAVSLARNSRFAVEFHLNSAANRNATGVEVLAQDSKRRQAQIIAKRIAECLGLPLRGNAGFRPHTSGQHHRLAFCVAGGLVVELFFVNNTNDVAAYERKRTEIARVIANAIIEANS